MIPDIPKCCDDEQWRSILGHEGRHMVSTCGRVFSLSRIVIGKRGGTYTIPNRLLRGTNSRNYRMFNLRLGGPREDKWVIGVHRLVLSAFVGPCPEGMQTCHNDGNPANNHLSNLRWDTPKSNYADQIIHGVVQRGENHGRSPLKNADVYRIRELGSQGVPQRTIAKEYGISQPAVSKIVRCETWAHI